MTSSSWSARWLPDGLYVALHLGRALLEEVPRQQGDVLGAGTGKELLARAIRRRSARREHPFVTLNWAAIQSGLLESELFGHEKGAFMGALARKVGRFELANQGTLFLDEVGDIPLDLQPKLLRALQEKEFERRAPTRPGLTQNQDSGIRRRHNLDLVDERRLALTPTIPSKSWGDSDSSTSSADSLRVAPSNQRFFMRPLVSARRRSGAVRSDPVGPAVDQIVVLVSDDRQKCFTGIRDRLGGNALWAQPRGAFCSPVGFRVRLAAELFVTRAEEKEPCRWSIL